MGYTPTQVNEMTVWEFACCCAGGSKKKTGSGDMSEDRLREIGIEGF